MKYFILLSLLFTPLYQVNAENYRLTAHQISDLTKIHKSAANSFVAWTNRGLIIVSSTTGSLLPVILPGIVIGSLVLSPIGIGLITGGATTGSVILFKGIKSYQAKPYYRMARILEYASGKSKRTKDENEFFEFFKKINPLKKQHPEQIKKLLVLLSAQKALEFYPLEKELTEMIEEGAAALKLAGLLKQDLSALHYVTKKIQNYAYENNRNWDYAPLMVEVDKIIDHYMTTHPENNFPVLILKEDFFEKLFAPLLQLNQNRISKIMDRHEQELTTTITAKMNELAATEEDLLTCQDFQVKALARGPLSIPLSEYMQLEQVMKQPYLVQHQAGK